MIGIDTNVLVRYVAQDDAEQCQEVNRLFEQASARNRLFISVVVVVESIWVLRRRYQLTSEQVLELIRSLAASKKVSLERTEMFTGLLSQTGLKARDITDAIIAAIAKDVGCDQFFTFDKKLARLTHQSGKLFDGV